jgi:ABC-type lipoprotein release transport system permease subunit
MSGLLFGVSPTDPVTFLGMALVLAAVAAAASAVPAWRAARVDPVRVLRAE